MKVSQVCYDFIKSFEGLSLAAYPDPATKAEPFTIGYGTTVYDDGRKARLGDVITKDRAEFLLKLQVDEKAKEIESYLPTLNQNQFDALVSFAYNCGVNALKKSTLLKKVKKNASDPSIELEFMKWDKAANKKLKGLTKRRQAEADLYFK